MEEGQYGDLFVKSEGHIGFAEEAESEVDDLHSALTELGTAAHTHRFMLVNYLYCAWLMHDYIIFLISVFSRSQAQISITMIHLTSLKYSSAIGSTKASGKLGFTLTKTNHRKGNY